MASGPYRVEPGTVVRLAELDPGDTGPFARKRDAKAASDADLKRLNDLQERHYADQRYAVLLVLQGTDTSGKNGLVRHLSQGLDMMGTEVTSFGQPTPEELQHDFLWRVHRRVPGRRMIGIFNRSHYEDVLIARVHELVPAEEWQRRHRQINDFERLLAENHTVLVKCLLHISKEEQRQRLQARLDNPSKWWKFNPGDLTDRDLWDRYTEAYEAALTNCSTPEAPWYVIPADHKWYRNYAVTRLLVETLAALDLQPPRPDFDPKQIEIR